MCFVLSCIIIPLILVIYYEMDLFLVFNYFGEKSITNNHLTGFAIALALLEGVPGFWALKKRKLNYL